VDRFFCPNARFDQDSASFCSYLVLRDVFELKRLREAIFPNLQFDFLWYQCHRNRQRTPTLPVRVDTHTYQIAADVAIRVAYYFSYRAYLALYWPDSDFENHLRL
jgi:hypothetical protein